ncbi:hypothetical protein [Actinomadura parmotrematis]|uniref:DUF4232 domain-containing protein n=1 Tax=Actinomadura parmotrematis TaxID=2864039 RepID=A0ABS7FZH4_9ACTN|nr:hypothetical protein [Actinomadura parmotrematis]MBW8485545.1 hypothetical protein [Actinomadura parmotrematis]
MKRSMTVCLASAALVPPLFGAAGCGNGADVEVTGKDPRVLVARHSGAAPAVMYAGRLRYDAGTRCLYFQPGRSGPEQAPVWPEGTRPVLRDGKRGVRLPSSGELLEGRTFTTGAGGGGTSKLAKGASACVPKGGAIVFSDDVRT